MRIYDTIVKRIPVEYGWSGDRKYCAMTDRGENVFLRIADISRLERKTREFQKMREVEALGIPMCRLLEFGTSDEGVYAIHSWIDGVDAEDAIEMKEIRGEKIGWQGVLVFVLFFALVVGLKIVEEYFTAEFEAGGRHERRVNAIMAKENEQR